MARRRTWTDDELTTAMQGATSWSQVCRRLGLRTGGSTLRRIRERSTELSLDVRGVMDTQQDARKWTDGDLVAAVARATNLNGVFAIMGLSVGGSAWRRMQDHIVRLELDTSHWTGSAMSSGSRRPRQRIALDDEEVRVAVIGARSIAEVARRLGLDSTNGSVHRSIRLRIDYLRLPTTEYQGQAWARGLTRARRPKVPLEQILVRDSTYGGGSVRLRERLTAEGLLDQRCAMCGLVEWCRQPAPLQLDHIDGDRRNNELTNLRILCPNCHAQTPTFCGRNIGRG